jgi:hypothetical protein
MVKLFKIAVAIIMIRYYKYISDLRIIMDTHEIENIKKTYRNMLAQYSNILKDATAKSQIKYLNRALNNIENRILDHKINIE